jgi:hypothetical protein
MGTDALRRRVLAVCACVAYALLVAPLPVAAQTQTPAATQPGSGITVTPEPTPAPAPSATPVPPGEPWWLRVAFAGHRVTSVRAEGDTIIVSVDGLGLQRSTDVGATWQATGENVAARPAAQGAWQVRNGRIGRIDARGAWHLDPGSPTVATTDDGGHSRIAAPAGLNGVVVAVDTDNVVWRRGGDGGWARALLLLPQHIAAGPPPITGVTAFDRPLTTTVYMATDGYSTLITTDGGDDWIRTGAGLPDGVLAITTDAARGAVFAATADGLWVHHLQAFPGVPSYTDAALYWRLAGIALVSAAAAALSIAGLNRMLR